MAIGCTPQNATYEEVMNSRKNGSVIQQVSINQTQDETIEKLDFLRNTVSLKENIYYMYNELLKIKKRVSTYAKEAVGLKRESVDHDNEIKRQMGTKIHFVLQQIMNYFSENKRTLNDIRIEAMKGEYGLTERQISQLVTLVTHTYNSIMAQQELIKPGGKVRIFTEQFVVDFHDDIGGTIDVLALFSDNTASVYDYKTSGKEGKIEFGSHGYEIKDSILPYYDSQQHDLAMTEYKRILLKRIGVKSIRESRLLPIALKYKKLENEKRSEGKNIKPELSVLIADPAIEGLRAVPTGGESSSLAGINILLEKQYSLMGILSEKLRKKGLSVDEKNRLKDRIKAIEKSISGTLIDSDINELVEVIGQIARTVNIRLAEPKFLENNVANPAYPNERELEDMLAEMNTYSGIMQETYIYFKDLEESDKAKYDILINKFKDVRDEYDRIHVALTMEFTGRVMDIIGKEYYNAESHLNPFKELGFFELQAKKISEIDSPIFHGAWKLIRDAQYEQKQAFIKMDKEVWSTTEALWKWASKSNIKRQDAYDMMINKDTGNLYAKLNSAFYRKRDDAIEGKTPEDLKFIKKSFELKDKQAFEKEYAERLEAEKKIQMASHNNLNDILGANGEVKYSAKSQRFKYNAAIEKFEKNNNLLKSDSAWLNKYNLNVYCKITNATMEENYSPEYRKIMSVKELNDYYNMYTGYVHTFSKMLGISDWRVIPDNFIPNVRKEMAEYLTRDSLNYKAAFKEFLDSFNVREEDVYRNGVVENGNVNQIPILFVNKLRT
jgi:hypothetical protein